MKKYIITATVLLLGFVQGAWGQSGNWADNCDATWGTDYQTASEFTISTAAQFAKFAYLVNAGSDFSDKTVKLSTDIDMADHYWTPIGRFVTYSDCKLFAGIFDGQDYSISNIHINNPDSYWQGLFSYMKTGTIRNLNLLSGEIRGSSYSGAFLGNAESSVTIENCYVNPTVTIRTSDSNATTQGGIVGSNSGTVSYCVSTACFVTDEGIDKPSNVGGIAGSNAGNINNCYYFGSKMDHGSNSGAIVGNQSGSGSTQYCGYLTEFTIGGVGSNYNGTITSVSPLTKLSGTNVNFTAGGDIRTIANTSFISTAVNDAPFKLIENAGLLFGGFYYFITGTVVTLTSDETPLHGFRTPDWNIMLCGAAPYTLTVGTTVAEGAEITLVPLSDYPWHGSGTSNDPYQIRETRDMTWLSENVESDLHYADEHFLLTNDLVYDGTPDNYQPVGRRGTYFAGTFEGGGHTISGIKTTKSNTSRAGIFGTVRGATIRNLLVANSTFSGSGNCGSIVSTIEGETVETVEVGGGTIENCHVAADVTVGDGTKPNQGGIVGAAERGPRVEITACTSAATVNGSDGVGGIIGKAGFTDDEFDVEFNDLVYVKDCLYYGTSVTGSNAVGGIVGRIVYDRYKRSSTTLEHNYYLHTASTVKGVGCEELPQNQSTTNADFLDNNGAVRVRTVTAEADIADMGTAVDTYTNGVTRYTSGIAFGNNYYSHVLAIVDGATSNSAMLVQYNGQTFDLKLRGRRLYKDGSWNTLCLPFSLKYFSGFAPIFEIENSFEMRVLDIERGYYIESQGEDIKYWTGVADGKLHLFFKKNKKEYNTNVNPDEIELDPNIFEAGKPYIVKWVRSADYNENDPAYDYVDPVFKNVTIDNRLTPVTSVDGNITFTPTYDAVTFEAEDRSVLFLGAFDTLYSPSGAGNTNVNACRAYFQLNNGIQMANSGSGGSGDDDDDEYIPVGGGDSRVFIIDVESAETGGDEPAAISEQPIPNSQFSARPKDACYQRDARTLNSDWYDLNGRRLSNSKWSNSQIKKGLYIENGKKILK